jgi:hypothetical protein
VSDTAGMLAQLRAEVAGQVAGAPGLDGVRARLSTLFAEVLITRTGDGWTVPPIPREEWLGELVGYWQSVLRPLALPNMAASSLSPRE